MRRSPKLSLALASLMVSLSGSAESQRPDDAGSEELFRFEAEDVVEVYDGESARIFYTREGTNAVPRADSDLSGVPDYVELSATTYDEALAFYSGQGFRAPVSDGSLGGDARLDVYLVDFFGSADGSFQRDECAEERCSGYMVQENDFLGYGYPSLRVAVRIIASHELFHAVQAAYDESQGAVFSEGTATWATETFDPSLMDFERAIRGYLSDPERPLSSRSSTVVDPFAYGSALWFQFIFERFGLPIMLDLLEGTEGAPWLEVLADELENRMTTIEDEFRTFAEWSLRLGSASGFSRSETYSSLSARSSSLPFADVRPRHFAQAMRVYEVNPEGRSTVVAALDENSPLSLLAVPLGAEGARVDRLVVGDIRVELDVQPDENVLLAVVNPAREGPSERTSVCIGGQTEVQTCLAELAPDAGTSDAGVDGGVQDGGVRDAQDMPDVPSFGGDAGIGDSGFTQDAEVPVPPSSGCSVGSSHASKTPWILLLIALAWRRRQTLRASR